MITQIYQATLHNTLQAKEDWNALLSDFLGLTLHQCVNKILNLYIHNSIFYLKTKIQEINL